MNEEQYMWEIEYLKKEIECLKMKMGNALIFNKIGKFIKRSFTKLNLVIGVAVIFIASSIIVYAQITKPYTFIDGTIISASEVNENFDSLYETAWSKVDTGGIYYDSGNVGIGTNAPQETLEVSGEVIVRAGGFTGNAAGATGGLEIRGQSGGYYPSLALDNGSQQWNIVAWSDNALSFVKSSGATFVPLKIKNDSFSNALVLAANGVGIGTPEPTEKLDVEGNVTASGFITGDITFQKDGQKLWRMFEDEDGLYLENVMTGRVYSFVLKELGR